MDSIHTLSPHAATLDRSGPALSASRSRRLFLALNALGGLAVLGSYAHGLLTEPAPDRLWGGVPEGLKALYTASMLAAAVGYFPMTLYVLFGLDPQRTRVGGFGWHVFPVLYALVLFPSALWLPLTGAMLDAPSGGLWLAVRGALLLVGVGSLGLAAAVAGARPSGPRLPRIAALVGAAAFVFQTAVLDALVWPAYFPL